MISSRSKNKYICTLLTEYLINVVMLRAENDVTIYNP